ncbi:hypothetical protein BDR26DRAFT_920390 [Obelidium mucronatum]|nr:hypothetical protein BDR26DRAFT_920390 [Obelidium mucronatum]
MGLRFKKDGPLTNQEAMMLGFKDAVAPIIEQLAILLAPLHNFLCQKIYGDFNGYSVVIIVSQIIYFLYHKNASKKKVTASHILVREESKIKEIQDSLEKEPHRFADVAKRHSVCDSASKGGALGSFSRGKMVKEFDAYCFDSATKENVLSPIIKTEFGYHLILVTKKAIA